MAILIFLQNVRQNIKILRFGTKTYFKALVFRSIIICIKNNEKNLEYNISYNICQIDELRHSVLRC